MHANYKVWFWFWHIIGTIGMVVVFIPRHILLFLTGKDILGSGSPIDDEAPMVPNDVYFLESTRDRKDYTRGG